MCVTPCRETGAAFIESDSVHVVPHTETEKKGKVVQCEAFKLAGSLPMIRCHLVEKIVKGL